MKNNNQAYPKPANPALQNNKRSRGKKINVKKTGNFSRDKFIKKKLTNTLTTVI